MNHCNFNLSLSLEGVLAPLEDAEIFHLINESSQRLLLTSVLGDDSELVDQVLQSVKMVSMHYLYTWILSLTNIFFTFVNRAIHRH